MAKKRELTPKQARFVEEYLIDLNATAAAWRAGYKNPEIGRQLLAKNNVKKAIEEALAKRSARTAITQDRVLKELARIAFLDPRKVFKWGPGGVTLLPSEGLTEDDAAAISEVSESTSESGGSIKGKLLDKLKALELLGKHLGMLTDKVQMDQTVSVNVFDEETRARLLEMVGRG